RRERLGSRVAAEERSGSVARQRLRRREHHYGDEEEGEEAEQDPAEDEPPDAARPRNDARRPLQPRGERAHGTTPADRRSESGAARCTRRPARARLPEPEGPVAIPEVVQLHDALPALDQALDLRAVAVEEVAEAPDDVAAVVVLELHHLVLDREPLLAVDGPERLLVEGQELVVGGVRPVGLVVRRGRQAPGRHL